MTVDELIDLLHEMPGYREVVDAKGRPIHSVTDTGRTVEVSGE